MMTLCLECLRTIPVHDGRMVDHRAHGAMCPASGGEPFTWTEHATRQAVANRSGSVCERCAQARATECHHRIPRSTGGRWSPANIVHLCHDCHAWVTDHPKDAHQAGLHLRSEENPTAIPIIRGSGHLVLLSDDLLPAGRKKNHRLEKRR